MSKPKQVTIQKDGFHTTWSNGDQGMVNVDVYAVGGTKAIIEWSYPKVFGNSIQANAEAWFDQAILQARSELAAVAGRLVA